MSSKGMIVGGAGSSLINFKIVGATEQPTTTKENTIWVNTDQKITSWAISTQEPETPAEGMVWIKAGNKSTLFVNLLKKNNITLYPIAVKQYLAGEWGSKETHVYTQGEWVLITADIYFVKDGVLTKEAGTMKTAARAYMAPWSEQREDGYLTGMPTYSSGWTIGSSWFSTPYDLTNYKQISGNVTVTDGTGNAAVYVIVSKYEPNGSTNNAVASTHFANHDKGNRSFSLDVSALSGPHYVGFDFNNGAVILLQEVVAVGND